jgi:hypothetical protein
VAALLKRQCSSAVDGDGETRGAGGARAAAWVAAMGRHGGGRGARAAARAVATGSTEEAEVLVRRRGSGDALGQQGVASSDRGARTRADRGGGGAREVGRCREASGKGEAVGRQAGAARQRCRARRRVSG